MANDMDDNDFKTTTTTPRKVHRKPKPRSARSIERHTWPHERFIDERLNLLAAMQDVSNGKHKDALFAMIRAAQDELLRASKSKYCSRRGDDYPLSDDVATWLVRLLDDILQESMPHELAVLNLRTKAVSYTHLMSGHF